MLYQSTRNNKIRITAHEAILKGISDDGGLFVPTEMPYIKDELNDYVGCDYYTCAKFILSKFLVDFTDEELDACIKGAYGDNKFGSDTVAPVVMLDRSRSVLELWHGPTCAFKDMALQILPRFLTCSMDKEGKDEKVLILVATSGDTGKAALEGFKDVKDTRILVFYPSEGVSNMQKLQMMTQEGENVRVCGIEGNFDDAQTGVKRIFNCAEMKDAIKENGFSFSSANSINWGRLVPQIVYYVYTYLQLLHIGRLDGGISFNVCVPTGNFGNILAAYYARKMGVPIGKLICASNKNDVLTEFLSTGVYDKRRDFHTTISPSMDILISSNLERLLFDISGFDDEYVKSLYASLSENGYFKVDGKVLNDIKSLFACGCCDDEETRDTIKNVFVEYNYIMDPHTAVAENVYRKYKKETCDARHTVVASTASAYKFPESVLEALGEYDSLLSEFELLDKLSSVTGTEIPDSLIALKNKKVRFDGVIAKDEMDKEVLSSVK